MDTVAEMRRAVGCLSGPTAPTRGRKASAGSTSDLSIDEALLLHAVGWEAVDVVCGVAVVSVPAWIWRWGSGEITDASDSLAQAARAAVAHMEQDCTKVGGRGVVGVQVDVEVHSRHMQVSLLGTAVHPVGSSGTGGRPFVSDLSARDFALLVTAGWSPVGLAFGSSFVYAPRRAAATALRQSTQNVELTGFTEAMYRAREQAMGRLQATAEAVQAQGVVAVRIQEGPMSFAGHAIGFITWGTCVRLGPAGHRYARPRVVVPVNDPTVAFAAESLRAP